MARYPTYSLLYDFRYSMNNDPKNDPVIRTEQKPLTRLLTLTLNNTNRNLFTRALRIVFFPFESNRRIESAVDTTQAVTQPDGLQAYVTGL